MTTDRDFDRLARAWLDLGPDEAPDRVIDTVLQAAETTPQVRRPIRWPVWRDSIMTRQPIFAATAAAVLVVVIGGALLVSRPTGPATNGAVPTAAPTVVPPSTSPSARVQVPAALQSMWVGPKRTVLGMPSNDRYRFRLSDVFLGFPDDQIQNDWFYSIPAATGPNELSLTATGSATGCNTGDVGRYTWSLSPSGARLHLTVVSDACLGRYSALAGDWTRVACTDTSDGCFGDLDAGTFPSQYVAPRVGPSESWQPELGAISYTIPDGWANSSDWPTTFSLTPSADYARWTSSGSPDGEPYGIWVFTRPSATTQPATCVNSEQATVKRTVSGLMDWVRSRPSLVTTTATPITIGGYSGEYTDVKVAPSWTAVCPDTTEPTAIFLSQSGAPSDGWNMGVAGAERLRLILLDIGAGDTVAIVIDSGDPARFQELVDEAMPIVSSFTFK